MLKDGQSSASAGVRSRRPRTVSSLAVRLFTERDYPMKALTISVILACTAILGLVPAMAAEAPQTPPQPLRSVTTLTPTTTTPPPTRRPLEVAEGQSCPGWMDVAKDAGWPKEELPMVGAVTYFESRCLNSVRGDNGISWTAWQIHTKSWCRPNRYWPDGYLQAMQIVTTCKDLMTPEVSARAALEIWRVGGWKQWTTHKLASTTLGQ
jgi:hypothetical protein